MRFVLLVNDQAKLRAELCRLIEGQEDLRLVAEAGGAYKALRLAMREAPTVVVMDLSLPDGDGITVTAEIMRQRPELRVLASAGMRRQGMCSGCWRPGRVVGP
jgi:DNA-binding NarL/FixJ family response regulator